MALAKMQSIAPGGRILVMEAVVDMERRVTERMELRFEKIELRLTALEFAVRKNSGDLAALQREVAQLSKLLGPNAIQALEARLGSAA